MILIIFLLKSLYPYLSSCNAQGLKKVLSNNPAPERFLVEEVSLKWARLQPGHPNKITKRAACPKDKLEFKFFSSPKGT